MSWVTQLTKGEFFMGCITILGVTFGALIVITGVVSAVRDIKIAKYKGKTSAEDGS